MYFMTVQLTFPKTACLFSNKKQNYKVLPSNLIFYTTLCLSFLLIADTYLMSWDG